MKRETSGLAPLANWQARQGSGRGTAAVANGQGHYTTLGPPLAVVVEKRGRDCVVGKIVRAQPLGCLVFAMAYRHQNPTTTVSIPPAALALARRMGCRWWVVRHDLAGRCYGLPLAEVERTGWLRASGGQAEWFVPLARFQTLPRQRWPFAPHTVRLGGEAQAEQLVLWGVGE